MSSIATSRPEPASSGAAPRTEVSSAVVLPTRTEHRRIDASPGHPAITAIRPTSGWRAINLAEVWNYRDLLYYLTLRDIKVRYKQTILGAAWAIIQPVMTMIVFTIFFGKLGGMAEHVHTPYPIFVFAALVPWTFFAGSVAQSSESLIQSSRMLSKVYYPRIITPLAAVGSQVVDFAIAFCVLLLMMVCYAVDPTVQLLAIPLLVLGVLFTATGAGMLLSALSVSYRDFRYIVPFMVQIWMFASPVAYALDIVPGRWRLLYALNPLAGIIGGFRAALLNQPFPWLVMLVSLFSATGMFIAGAFLFRRMERRFADII